MICKNCGHNVEEIKMRGGKKEVYHVLNSGGMTTRCMVCGCANPEPKTVASEHAKPFEYTPRLESLHCTNCGGARYMMFTIDSVLHTICSECGVIVSMEDTIKGLKAKSKAQRGD